MADNYVALKIKATDDAKPDLTDLKAKLEELQGKVATARANVDSADADATLTGLQANLDAVSKKVASPRIDMAGASRALAQLTAVDAAMGHLDGQSEKTRGSFAAFGGAVNTALLGIPTGIGEMTMFQKVLAGVNVATGIGEPAVAALTVAVGGLGAGLVSAGAGLGVFGLVAKGVYSQVSTAVTAWGTATSTTGKASATAMAQYQAALAALPPSQQAVAKSITGAEGAWQNFVQANTGGVAKIMSQGIGLLPKVFQAMQPFLGPTEKALSGLVSQLGKGLNSSGFKSWIDAFAKASGPNITNLGQAIGHIAVGLGGILKAFLPMATTMTGGLDKLTGKFAQWGTTLTGHSGFQSLVSMAKQDGPLLVQVLKNIGGAAKNLGGDMAGLSGFSNSRMLLQLAGPLSALIKAISGHPDLVNLALWGAVSFDGLKKAKTGLDGVKTGLDGIKAGKAALTNLAAGFNDAGKAASESSGAWGTAGGKIKKVFSGIRGSAADAAAGEEAAAGDSSEAWTLAGHKEGMAARQAAAEQEGAAEDAAAANEEGAAESSSSWIAAAASAVAGWASAAAGMVAQAAVWVASNTAKVAIVVAENVAGAVATAAAWIAANAVMLLGIGAVVALVVLAVIEIVKHWKSIVHGVEEAFDDVKRVVTQAVDAVVKFVKSHWQLLLAILTGPIGLAVLFIKDHWSEIVSDTKKFASDVIGDVTRFASDVLHWFEHLFTSVVSTAARWYSDMVTWVRRTFDDFISTETRGIGNIVRWFAGLPGKIIHAIASLPGMLLSAGAHAAAMFVQGLKSVPVVGPVIGWGESIVDHLPHSPAKKGPLSGSGSPDIAGRKIATMLRQGMLSGLPDVSSAAARMAGSVNGGLGRPGAAGYGAYGGANGKLEVLLTFQGTLLKAMQAEVRNAGGDPQMFQKKVAYR